MHYFDYNQEQSEGTPSQQLTVLDGLSEEEWQSVLKHAKSIQFKAGDLLLKVGESDDALYILVSGEVEVIGSNSFGFEKRIATISEGSVFGELAFFDNQPRSASIRAVQSGQVLRLSRKGFERISAWNPQLAQQLLFDLGRVLAHRFRNEIPYKI